MVSVGAFRHSLSFPNKSSCPKPPISYHNRSVSLPCRSHPLISRLRDEIGELRAWSSHPTPRTSAWLCDGMARLRDIHDYLVDLLQLPQSQDSLRRQPPPLLETLLDHFLRLIDVYGIFQTSLLALKQEHLAAQVALRRRDHAKIVLYAKARTNMTKDMRKLVSSIRAVARHSSPPSARPVVSIGDAELSDIIAQAIDVTLLLSLALFNGIASSFASPTSLCTAFNLTLSAKPRTAKVDDGVLEFQQPSAQTLCGLRKKGDETLKNTLKAMRALEVTIADIETASDNVFRGLINTRVSLLNTLTQ